MSRFIKLFFFTIFTICFQADPKIQYMDPDPNGITHARMKNDGSLFLQTQSPYGDNLLVEHGPQYSVKQNPKMGLPDYQPMPVPNFAVGVTPLHMTYQYATYPQRIQTPLNMYSYPQVHVPQYGLDHPMNMHHPFNNVFGMQQNMYTGNPSSNQFMFMNPNLHGSDDLAAAYKKQGVSSFPPGTRVPSQNLVPQNLPDRDGDDRRLGRQPGFNPSMSGVGPFGAGGGAFNPAMTPMGPWFYLSPFNSGSD